MRTTKARVLAVLSILATTLTAVVVSAPSPSGAELVTPQATPWGLATEGPSNNLGNWDALGWATEPVGGMMIVGGKFLDTTNGGQTYRQSYLAAFDAGDGSFLTWWRPTVGGAVAALETTPDGGLMVGGEMGTWNGTSLGALQKIDPATGNPWPGWNTRVYGGSSMVRDIRLEPDGYLYVVGTFNTASDNGVPFNVNGAVRMDPATGVIDRNWLPQPSGGSIWGVSVSRTTNEVYLAGWFTSMNGNILARGFAGVSATDASLLHDRSTIAYNTCAGCTQYFRLYDVVATEFGDVWVGGEQHAMFILDEANNLQMDLMHYTNCNVRYQVNCNRSGGEFQEIERIGNRIYATCHCWGSHMTDTQVIMHSNNPTGTYTGSISGIAAYDVQTGQRIQSFNPYMAGDAGGFAVAGTSDGCVWTAGGFNAVGPPGNQQPGRDLVRLCDENGAGPDPQPNPTPPAPAACTTSVVGTTVTVSWTVPAMAESVVVERQVGVNGTYSWRGSVNAPANSFVETAPNGEITTYRVKAKYAGSQFSVEAPCAPPVDLTQPPVNDVLPPASCSASNNVTAATITWAASVGATDYRVYRSIDGSQDYWRGLTSATTLNDTLRSTGIHSYSVQARGLTGVWSASTPCAPPLDPVPNVPDAPAPASCSASNVSTAATITWAASVGATDYRVYRSIDGSQDYWRGLTSATTLNDTLRSTGIHSYSVQARGLTGVWSASTPCVPPLDPVPNVPDAPAPASCSASNVSTAATITWAASVGATDYRVYRSIDGSQDYWRGLTSATTLNDTLRSTGIHSYSVQARGLTGVWSASTVCAPALNP